jgi:hypothetical protein
MTGLINAYKAKLCVPFGAAAARIDPLGDAGRTLGALEHLADGLETRALEGTNPKTGQPWSTTHTAPYGYWKGTRGADGMQRRCLFWPGG